MKRLAAAALALWLLLAPALAEGAGCVEMEIYLIDPCGGCAGRVGSAAAAARFRTKSPRAIARCLETTACRCASTTCAWTSTARIRTSWTRAWRRLASTRTPYRCPSPLSTARLFLADGSMDDAIVDYLETGAYPGVEAALREQAEYRANRQPGRVVYLYSEYCESCRDISRWLTYGIPADYELVAYDIYTPEGQAMEEYFIETLDIPAEAYCVPLIVYGRRMVRRQGIDLPEPCQPYTGISRPPDHHTRTDTGGLDDV